MDGFLGKNQKLDNDMIKWVNKIIISFRMETQTMTSK